MCETKESLIATAKTTYVSPSGRGDGCTCGFSQLAALPSTRRGKGNTTAPLGCALSEKTKKGDNVEHGHGICAQ